MKDTKQEFPYSEFHRFRWAHANANSFLYGVFIVLGLIFVLIRWLLGVEPPKLLSQEFIAFIVVIGAISFVIPRMGFHLARHIYGTYYKPDHFGSSYKEYRLQEKQYSKKPDEMNGREHR
jgi:hypothetical protein